MRKNLVKRIVSISVIVLVLALVVTTIVLAVVPKTMTNPIADGFYCIKVYQGSKSAMYTPNPTATGADAEHNEIFNKIVDLHEESLKDTLLSAIFQGTGSFDVRVVKDSTVSNVISTIAEAEGNAIIFEYSSQQVLKLDGETYEDELSAAGVVKYDMIVLSLNASDNYEECIAYLADTSTKKSIYQVKFLAHQSELNDYVGSLDIPA